MDLEGGAVMTARRRLAALVVSSSLVLAAGCALTPASASAASSSLPCASSARITSRSGPGYLEWAGKETQGKLRKFTGKKVTRGVHFYELKRTTIKLRFGGNTFRLGANAIFALGCSGEAAGDRAIMPSIRFLRGSATVHTTHAVEGSVVTEEALYGPVVSSRATSYAVIRTLHQHKALTLGQTVNWFLDYRNQPTGTSTTKTHTSLRVNVTPYVGPRHGSCRQVHSAKLVTTRSFGHGTAVYHF